MLAFEQDPNKYSFYGEALLSNGLVVRHAINGIGLVTRGLVWQLYDIFIDTGAEDGITTSWSDSESAITTTWTPVQYGIWGEYLP